MIKFQRKIWMAVIIAVMLAVSGMTVLAQEEPEGDPARGGRLYVAWDLEIGELTPFRNHTLWRETEKVETASWRCVTCHGWVYKGRVVDDIEYPGLFSMVADPQEEVIAWLDGSKNPDHNFSRVLSDEDLLDLSAFLISGLIEPDLIVDPETLQAGGIMTVGEDLYKQACRTCHGADGARINFGTASSPVFMGDLAEDNPWLAAHTIRNGHPGLKTPTAEDFDWSFSLQIDLLTYLQRLPRIRQIGKVEFDPIDYSDQAGTIELVYASIAMMVVVFGGVGFVLLRERISRNS